jgi:outer membrane beta-barrel protein
MYKLMVMAMVLGAILLSGPSGWCAEQVDEEKVVAVQNRIFHRTHEIDTYFGYIADDDFFNVFPLGIGYTFHFSEHFAWEVARVQYMFNTDKDLSETLQNDFDVQPERFPEQKYMVHSHFVFKPLYGKHAYMNRSIINNEIYLFAGPGMVQYEWDYSTGESLIENAFSLSVGAGLKYFLSEKISLSFEIRDLINFLEEDTENYIYFGLSIGFRFNMAPRRAKEDPTMKKLKRILDEE